MMSPSFMEYHFIYGLALTLVLKRHRLMHVLIVF